MRRLTGLSLALFLVALLAVTAWAALYFVEMESVASGGLQGNAASEAPAVSADAQVVAFTSAATNLVAGDDNGTNDVFVHDRVTGATELASVAVGGGPGNNSSGYGGRAIALSADGRFVAFWSYASNLVEGDTNNQADVFVRDRLRGITMRASVSSTGVEGDSASGYGGPVSISADGRYVAFQSYASNLVGGDTNGAVDMFVRDLIAGTTTRVSVASDGAEAPAGGQRGTISADGAHVVFASSSPLVTEDTNGAGDVYVRDVATGITTRVSVSSYGAQGDGESGPGMSMLQSSDGRYVCFASMATNLVTGDTNGQNDIFVHDRVTGVTKRVNVAEDGTQANGYSERPAISADGRYVAYQSTATNLMAGDTNGNMDVYVRDWMAEHTTRASITSGLTEPDGACYCGGISADGRFIASPSLATNMVGGDTNGASDVFLLGNFTFAPPSGPPAAPSGLAATPQGGTRVVLSWSDNSFDETGFYIERSTHPTLYFQQVGATAASRGGFTDWGLEPADCYYYRVRAYNAAGQSAYSATVMAKWHPTNFTATALSSSRLRLTWADVSGESGYVLERGPGPFGPTSHLVSLAPNVTSWTDSTCSKGAAYLYRVRATHTLGDSYAVSLAVTMPNFDDVLPTSGQYTYVQAMAREGITTGCQQSPPLYCPDAAVTRGQMAVFLCRAAGWTPLTPPVATFSDVPASHPQFGYVEAMWGHGVTTGCGGGKYCPDAPVTRGQMAVFLCRAAAIAAQNPATPTFGDVPKTSGQYTYIEGIYDAGITVGCVTTPPLQYCPNSPVTRGQMAVFLCRAFEIPTVVVSSPPGKPAD